MKLWSSGSNMDIAVEKFTIGRDREIDLQLAEEDALGSIAHAIMLSEVGLMNRTECMELVESLRDIYQEASRGELVIKEGVEDIHSQIEMILTERHGAKGKKIHSGRSRNDQVLLDLRLYMRRALKDVVNSAQLFCNALLTRAEESKEFMMPGYTHMQVAMVSSFGQWFSAYAESMIDDLRVIHTAHEIVNQNPLGSGAGYGSSFPLNRARTTELLGFRELSYNAIHAQLGRGKYELFVVNAISGLAATVGKWAMDVCLFMGQNYGFFSLPKTITTGSSIMPHKSNPDVVELIRANCNQLMALPSSFILGLVNLPVGYHRDFQLLKEPLFKAIDTIKEVLQMSALVCDNLEVNPGSMDNSIYDYAYSVESINRYVTEGMPFRDAYRRVNVEIKEGAFVPLKQPVHTHEGSIGNLCLNEINAKLSKVLMSFQFGEWQQREYALLNDDLSLIFQGSS